jgi:hypothetical protein
MNNVNNSGRPDGFQIFEEDPGVASVGCEVKEGIEGTVSDRKNRTP